MILLLRGSRGASYEELVEMVYPNPDTQPLDARGCLYRSVGTLRKLLPSGTIVLPARRGRLFVRQANKVLVR